MPYGDADCVVRLLGRERGRFSAFARGARASKRRFPGLMAPALGHAIVKSRRGDMLDLQELDVDSRLMALATELKAWGFAGYVVELVERFLPDGAPVPDFYGVVEDTLLGLARHGGRAAILRAFELRLLDELGVLPDLSEASDDPGLPVVAYDPLRGHLLAHEGPGAVPFSDDARQAALFLLSSDTDDAIALSVDDAVLREASQLFAHWLRRQGVALRSLEVLRALR
jgi:DNA repair protein RecO (recombination protein O)